MHVVGEMVDYGEADTGRAFVGIPRCIGNWLEVDVVNADIPDPALATVLAAPAIHQIDEGITNALDRRYVQFHGAGTDVIAPRTQFEGTLVSLLGIGDAKGHGADRGSMQSGKALGKRVRLGVDDEIDATLTKQRDVFRAMASDCLESHPGEHRREFSGIRCGIFDEFEAINAHGIGPVHVSAHSFSPRSASGL